MAEERFTQEQRDALINFRRAQRGKTVMDVGNVIGGAAAAFRNVPFTPASLPGADNLTAAQRAEIKAKLADVLAKLAQAERESLSSDQDYAARRAEARGALDIALLNLQGTVTTASGNVQSAKADAYKRLATDASTTELNAALSRELDAEGQGMVASLVGRVQDGGAINPAEMNLQVQKHLAELEPARRPAYVAALNREMQASGNPALRDFNFYQSLSTSADPGDPAALDLVLNIQGLLDDGNSAALEAEQRQSVAATEKLDNADKLARLAPGAPNYMRTFSQSLTEERMPAEMRNISAPAPAAPVEEQRAYVELATGGQSTVDDEGVVRPVLPAGVTERMPDAAQRLPSTPYAAWAKSTPRVAVPADGGVAQAGATPSGGGYSLSGPTADTIASIRKLRANIEQQIADLDKSALPPFEAARQAAYAASREMPGFQWSDPDRQRRFATRQAKREQREVNREQGAERDEELLSGRARGGVIDKGAAKVRSLFRKKPGEDYSDLNIPLDLTAIPTDRASMAEEEGPGAPKGEAPPPELDIDRMRAAGEAPGQAPPPSAAPPDVPPPSEEQTAAEPDSVAAIRRRAFEELMASPPPQMPEQAAEAPVDVAAIRQKGFEELMASPPPAAGPIQRAAPSPVTASSPVEGATPEAFFAAARQTPGPADVKPKPMGAVAAGLRAAATSASQQQAAQQVAPAPGGPDLTSPDYWRNLMPELRAEDPRALRKKTITDAVGY